MKNISKIEITWHLYQEGVKADKIALRVGVNRATTYRWIKSFRQRGYRRTINYYKNSKRVARRKLKSDGITKNRIYKIRGKHHNCCGEKIRYWMKKEYSVDISVKTIYLILNEKYVLRRRYKKNKYGEAPKGNYERDVLQADTVDFGEVYAYTYIDTYTRQALVDLETGLESIDGYASLTIATEVFKKVRLLQNDGGSEFESVFRDNVFILADEHRVSRPYKKNEQSFIESFNRTLRKECLGWRKYNVEELPNMKVRVDEWLKYYNNERPHLGLNMKTPNEVSTCRIFK